MGEQAMTNWTARRPARVPISAMLITASLMAGCQVPDRPSAAPDPLASRVLDLLRPDTIRTLRVSPGVDYRYLWSPVGPWAVHVLEADVSSCRVGFTVVRAPGSPGTQEARRRVSWLMETAPEGAVAAVNGDFFTIDGSPQGPEISTMGVRSSPSAAAVGRPAFFWSRERGPMIGTLDEIGEITAAEDSSAARAIVVAGFPEILDGGRRVGDLEVSSRRSFAGIRHPRTAVAYSDASERLWIVVVEGRLGSRSSGMTLPELAELLEGLGAEEALNLDGGGSSVMVLGSRPVSRPSDEEGERPVVNALVIESAEADCRS